MVLAQKELRAAVEAGEIKFDPPLEPNQWAQASVDLRLGRQFTQLLQDMRGLKVSLSGGGLAGIGNIWEAHELAERNEFGQLNTFCLEPGQFILATTYETITVPNNLIGLVEGRSSFARLGLSMHQTAPWIQPGFRGRIILEIANHGPLRVELTPIVDRPCQLAFFQLTSALDPDSAYGSKSPDSFSDQKHPFDRPKKKPR